MNYRLQKDRVEEGEELFENILYVFQYLDTWIFKFKKMQVFSWNLYYNVGIKLNFRD